MASAEVEVFVAPNLSMVDWGALLQFIHNAFAYMDERIDPPSSLHRMTAQSLREKAEKEILVLAKRDNALMGCMFCRIEPNCIYVGKVAVCPAHQGQGIGKRLFQNAFELAKQRDLPELELETRVELIENQQAFGRLGFKQTGTSAHEGYDRPTSITMRATV